MGRKSNGFEAELIMAFCAVGLGWARNLFHVPGLVRWIQDRIPGYAAVDDGNGKGRGVTFWDVFRPSARGGYDLLQVKTSSAGERADGTMHWKISLGTGNGITFWRILDAISAGLIEHWHVVIVFKGHEARGGGYLFCCIDLAPILRQFGMQPITHYPGMIRDIDGRVIGYENVHGYKNKVAPVLYQKLHRTKSGAASFQRRINAGLDSRDNYPQYAQRIDDPRSMEIVHGDGFTYGENTIGIQALEAQVDLNLRSGEGMTRVQTLAEIAQLVETPTIGFGLDFR